MIEHDQPPNIQHFSDDVLNEFLDGNLDSDEIVNFEAHLRACTNCTARLEDLRTVFSSLDTLPDIFLERDFSVYVVSAIQPDVIISKRLKWGLAAQVILALIMLSLVLPRLLQTWQPALQRIQQPLNEQIQDILLSWTADFSAQFIVWQICLSNLVSEWQPPSLPVTSQTMVWPIIIIASLVFVVGNGLILRKFTHNNIH
jgi:hypothetical protein